MQSTNGKFGILLGDQHADLDFRGRDDLNVDALFREGFEHLARHTYVGTHAHTNDGHLGHIRCAEQFLIGDLLFVLFDHLKRTLEFTTRNGKGHVGAFAVFRDVLHDHVDIDICISQRAED